MDRAAPPATIASLLFLLLCRPSPAAAQFSSMGGTRAGGSSGRAGRPTNSWQSYGINKELEQMTNSMILNGGWGGLSGSGPGVPFGLAGGGGLGSRPSNFDPNKLEKTVEPLTGPEFQDFLAEIGNSIDAAAITSQALNLVSGIVYTVSGGLATISVGLSFTTIIPLFFFGLFNLQASAITFVQGLQNDYQFTFLNKVIEQLAKIDALKEDIKSGKFIMELEEHLEKVKSVRDMLKDLRTNSPIAMALQKVQAKKR